MTSPHTGSKELLKLVCGPLTITIQGKPGKVLDKEKILSSISFACPEDTKEPLLTILGDTQVLNCQKKVGQSIYLININPLFFEQRDYQFHIELAEDAKLKRKDLEIRSFSSAIAGAIKSSSETFPVWDGVVNYGSDIGHSNIQIYISQKLYLDLTIEVFPSKMDYHNDYKVIMDDITKEIYSLVFDTFKKTYQNYDVGDTKQMSLIEFFAIIQKIYCSFMRSLDLIIREPHHQLIPVHTVIPGYKSGHVDLRTTHWLVSHPDSIEKSGKNYRVAKYLALEKPVSYDTKENRFTKSIIVRVIRKLRKFRTECEALDSEKLKEVICDASAMEKGLRRRLNSPLFFQISEDPTPLTFSMVFSMAPGYQDCFKYYLMLMKGLTINADVFSLSEKDLALLYEYWCFIGLNSILRNKYHQLSQDFIQTDHEGLKVTLVKGGRSTITYENPDRPGEKITLNYNQEFDAASHTATTTQKPDNVLSLSKYGKNGEEEFSYVFDAKYRIGGLLDDENYLIHYKTPGPTEADINTMHRYRDSIIGSLDIGSEKKRKLMFGAYVLFPYKDQEEFKTHPFYKSIEEVNIGGLPFLPTSKELVTKMLDTLINESPKSDEDRVILPNHLEEILGDKDFNNRDVLVGELKSEDQLEINKTNLSYWIPKRLVDPLKDFPIHYIAIYQSKTLFRENSGIYYFGKVSSMTEISRSEIKESPKESAEIYYYFKVDSWNLLPIPVRINRDSPYTTNNHLMTSLFLLKHSSFYPELKIRNKNQYRLMYELKRLIGNWDINELDSATLEFSYNKTKVFTCGINIIVEKEGKEYYYPILDFKKWPRETMEKIEILCEK